MFLYCIEHIFEGAYRVPRAEFNRTAAAMQGSSYMPMPKWWHWVTLGCEYHHIHHANPRVPLYRMAVSVSAERGLTFIQSFMLHL